MRKMKIAMVVSARFFIPPPSGTIFAPMLIAKDIAEGLAKKGHEVAFFAPKGSNMKVDKMFSGGLEPLYSLPDKEPEIFRDSFVREKEKDKIANLMDQYLVSCLYKENQKKKFDVLHFHLVEFALPFSLLSEIPTVYTLHDPIYPWRVKIFNLFKNKNQHFVSISNAQRKPAPKLNWLATIYNGLNLKLFPFSDKPKDYLLFLGRIIPVKGPDIAIKAAQLTKENMIISGIPNTGEYWDKKIKPHLGKNIKYVGFTPQEKIPEYYGSAKALLCPIQWEEPFGLTFIESMACGTPVITFNRGSAKEVIKNGKTGFIVNSVGEMAKAIKKIGQISRKECRKWVEEKFSIERMVDQYEKAFYQIVNRKES